LEKLTKLVNEKACGDRKLQLLDMIQCVLCHFQSLQSQMCELD